MMMRYQDLVLRLAWRRIAQLEGAPRNGLRLLPSPRRHLRLVSSNDAISGSIHPLRASQELKRSRE
jgi:hypothetical protein